MGVLMDQVMMRIETLQDPGKELSKTLKAIKPYCRWTEGTWESLGWKWNEVQSTHSHINKLSEFLCRLERDLRKNR